ncbi:hypothetical protein BGZ63DRAFT_353822, partial [Mariannaea sp. PMI_226]
STVTMTETRTNLGPLTTRFTYPASCRVAILACTNCDYGWQGQTCSDNSLNTQGVQDNIDCWPERHNSSLSTGVALNGFGFYSPGISCPAGYTTACAATGTVVEGFNFQFPLVKGFRCSRNGDEGAQTCYSIASTGSLEAAQCSAGKTNDYGYVEVPATVSAVDSLETSYSLRATITIYAPLFQLNHRSTDFQSSTMASASVTETASSEGQSTKTQQASQSSSASKGLSTGAKAGIGAGVGVVALLVLGVAIFLFLRKRRKNIGIAELPPGQVYPVPAKSTPPVFAELDERASRSELP